MADSDLQKGTWANNMTSKYLKERGDAFVKLTDQAVEKINKNLFNNKEIKIFTDNWEEKQERIKKDNVG